VYAGTKVPLEIDDERQGVDDITQGPEFDDQYVHDLFVIPYSVFSQVGAMLSPENNFLEMFFSGYWILNSPVMKRTSA